MTLTSIQFATQSYEGRSKPASVQQLLNLYLEANPADAKSPAVVHGTPGLKAWTSVGSGPVRGMISLGPNLFVVTGNECYVVDSAKTATLLGTIPGTGHVTMIANATQVAISQPGWALYVATATTLISTVESALVSGTYQDGYGIWARANSEDWIISGADDFTSLNALDLSNADGLPDHLVAVISDHRELFLLGERSIELWYNSGNAAFPFERAAQGFMERGCAATYSVAKHANAVYWLGDDYRVYKATGYSPQPISTHAVEHAIAGYTDQTSARAFIYEQEGHVFYCISFVKGTWCYDISTGRWGERVSDGESRWRANSHQYVWKTHLVGDFETGDIFELDLDTYLDNGSTLRRVATSPPLHAAGNGATMSRFYIDFEAGVGLTSGQGSDPEAMLDWSDNDGRTWSDEVVAKMGKIGEYRWRAEWSRLGSFQTRTLRVAVSDPVKIAIHGAYAQVDGLMR